MVAGACADDDLSKYTGEVNKSGLNGVAWLRRKAGILVDSGVCVFSALDMRLVKALHSAKADVGFNLGEAYASCAVN